MGLAKCDAPSSVTPDSVIDNLGDTTKAAAAPHRTTLAGETACVAKVIDEVARHEAGAVNKAVDLYDKGDASTEQTPPKAADRHDPSRRAANPLDTPFKL